MRPAQAALISGGRLHLHHGPIDLIIGADPEPQRNLAFEAAFTRFQTILQELTRELPLLRAPLTTGSRPPEGAVATRMFHACRPHATQSFVTPMAAVAGAVAEEVLAAMLKATGLARAYVNNGGDIAVHLSPGARFNAAIAGVDGADLGRITLSASDPVAGLATSGQRGRSLSLGIAESVTVLARSAARADVAATLIANAVDLPGHPAILRAPASESHPESDLGRRKVVTNVGPLTPCDVAAALTRGRTSAETMLAAGQISAAHLRLRGQTRIVGAMRLPAASREEPAHA